MAPTLTCARCDLPPVYTVDERDVELELCDYHTTESLIYHGSRSYDCPLTDDRGFIVMSRYEAL